MNKDLFLRWRIIRCRSDESEALLVGEPFHSALILHFNDALATINRKTFLTTQKMFRLFLCARGRVRFSSACAPFSRVTADRSVSAGCQSGTQHSTPDGSYFMAYTEPTPGKISVGGGSLRKLSNRSF